MQRHYPCSRCNMDDGSPVCLQDERCQKNAPRTAPEQAAGRGCRPLREGEVMGAYIDFDRTADKSWSNAEYLTRFGLYISERTAAAENADAVKRLRDIAFGVRLYGAPDPNLLASRIEALCNELGHGAST